MRLSIITINFNNRDGLRKTIESVVNQTWQEFEYIIIDGGSTDGSVDVIKEYADRIDYWVSEPDKGIYNAMNKGVAAAHGEYLLFLNSGDELADRNILQQVCNKLCGVDIIMGLVRVVPSNRIAYTDVEYPLRFQHFYLGCPVPHPASFIRAHLFEKHMYDENYKIVSDWKFFLQTIILENCSYTTINEIITNFKEGGISDARYACEEERREILMDLIPPRILIDYQKSLTGFGYDETAYDLFFVRLRSYKYKKIIYTISVILVKIISCFRPSAKTFRKFPYFTK